MVSGRDAYSTGHLVRNKKPRPGWVYYLIMWVFHTHFSIRVTIPEFSQVPVVLMAVLYCRQKSLSTHPREHRWTVLEGWGPRNNCCSPSRTSSVTRERERRECRSYYHQMYRVLAVLNFVHATILRKKRFLFVCFFRLVMDIMSISYGFSCHPTMCSMIYNMDHS